MLLLALPSPSLRTVGIVLGIALLAFAVFEAFEVVRRDDRAEQRRSSRHDDRLGRRRDAVLVWPAISQLALLYAAGAASIVLAVAEAAVALQHDATPASAGSAAAVSVVAFVFGIALLASPGNSLHAVIVLLGIYLVVLGGLRVLHAAEAWRQNRSAWS